MFKSIYLLLLLAAAPSGTSAQAADPVTPLPLGTRARIFAPTLAPGHWQGTVLGQRGDTLLLGGGSVRGQVPIPAIERIEVHRGPNYGTGIASGAVAGAAAFGALYLLESQDSYGGVQLSQMITALAWGAGLGGFLGFVIAPARWETVFQRSGAAR